MAGRASRAGADGVIARIQAAIRHDSAGKRWWVRAPVLAWLAWILVHYWNDPAHVTLFQGIDLAFHEIGHIVWAPLGEFMAMAGGTLTQLLLPVAAGTVLYRQRDWFGVAFAVSWVGINCFEIALYAGDAVVRRLPLVSPSTAEPLHDWAYLLGRLGALQHTGAVAMTWRWAGGILMTAGILLGARVLWVMAAAAVDSGDPAMSGEEARFLAHLEKRD